MTRAPWVGLFGRQLIREVAVNSAVALFAGLALFVAVDLVETGNVIRREVTLTDVLLLELYSLPLVATQIFHLAAVIGTTTAVGSLLRRREIVAIFAAGATPSVILKPALLAGALFGLLLAATTEWVTPPAREGVTRARRALGMSVKKVDQERHTWLRGKHRLYRVEDLIAADGRELAGVLMLSIEDGKLRDRIDVERLSFDGERWVARGVVRRRFGEERITTETSEQETMDLTERPRDFVRGIGDPERMTYGVLAESVAARERLGQPSVGHRLELYRRHAHPLALLVAMVLGVALMLRTARSPSVALALAIGAGIGFTLWLAEGFGLALGSTSAVSELVAAHAGLTMVGVAAVVAWVRAFARGVEDA